MLIPVTSGRNELSANGFKPQKDGRNTVGEWWIAPAGYPKIFMQYRGPNNDQFDTDQLAYALANKTPPLHTLRVH